MADVPWHLWHRPDGKYQEMRLVHRPGAMVKVIRGPYAGQAVKIEHMEGQIQDEDGRLVDEVGYGVQLESGKWVTVAWDTVEGHPTPETEWKSPKYNPPRRSAVRLDSR